MTPFFRSRRKCPVTALGLRKPNCVGDFLEGRVSAACLLPFLDEIQNLLLSSRQGPHTVYLVHYDGIAGCQTGIVHRNVVRLAISERWIKN